MRTGSACSCLAALSLAACAVPTPQQGVRAHLHADDSPLGGSIPPPVAVPLALPPARPAPQAETYSVAVNNVPLPELLLGLARDSGMNLDLHPGVSGNVTLNAVDQTLPQLLERIARQTGTRFELDGRNLSFLPDRPFLRHYKVDYMNVARKVSGTISTNMQIATAGPSAPGNAPAPSATSNVSNTRIENSAHNQFWEALERNIQDILRENDKLLPEGSSETLVEQSNSQTASGAAALPQGSGQRAAQALASALQINPNPGSSLQATGNSLIRRNTYREAASVIVNPEGGIVTVRATLRQHDRVQEFLDRIIDSANRQVLIEATIVEVALKDGYEQGINWSQLVGGGQLDFLGNALTKNAFNFQYARDGNPDALITLLASYGDARVLSSPRLSVLNHQTALLKVVENYVYFNVKADTTTTANVGTTTTYTTTPQSVSVGLVVSVTPQISDSDNVILNIRPTVTSVAREIADPNPELLRNNIANYVPVIRTREIESVMRVASGNTAVLGGLMEDRIDYRNQRVPLLGQLPVAGELLNNRNNQAAKTELVIFLRPQVIRETGMHGDYGRLNSFLPGPDFFDPPEHARPLAAGPGR